MGGRSLAKRLATPLGSLLRQPPRRSFANNPIAFFTRGGWQEVTVAHRRTPAPVPGLALPLFPHHAPRILTPFLHISPRATTPARVQQQRNPNHPPLLPAMAGRPPLQRAPSELQKHQPHVHIHTRSIEAVLSPIAEQVSNSAHRTPPTMIARWRRPSSCPPSLTNLTRFFWSFGPVITRQVSQLIVIDEQARRNNQGLPDLTSGWPFGVLPSAPGTSIFTPPVFSKFICALQRPMPSTWPRVTLSLWDAMPSAAATSSSS